MSAAHLSISVPRRVRANHAITRTRDPNSTVTCGRKSISLVAAVFLLCWLCTLSWLTVLLHGHIQQLDEMVGRGKSGLPLRSTLPAERHMHVASCAPNLSEPRITACSKYRFISEIRGAGFLTDTHPNRATHQAGASPCSKRVERAVSLPGGKF